MNNKEISKLYKDEITIRLIAAQVVILCLLALYYHSLIIITVLTIDFALRAFTEFPSPLSLTGKGISKILSLKKKPVFAIPKKFAALLGFVFSVAILILLILKSDISVLLMGTVLIFCAVLESVFKVCLGCYVYDAIIAPFKNRQEKV